MKGLKLITAFVLLHTLSSQGQSIIKHQTYYNNPQRIKEIYFLNKTSRLITGVYKLYNENSVLVKEYDYLNGKLNGPFKEWYDNGNKKTETTFKENEENGLSRFYYPDGKLESEEEKTNGITNGYGKGYYPSGSLKVVSHFKMGVKNGEYEEYYKNGKLSLKGEFIDDKAEGKFYDYTENGDLLTITEMSNNEKNGEQIIFSKNKNIVVSNSWSSDKLIQLGAIKFNPSIINDENKAYQAFFHATEYGIQSDWFDVGSAEITKEEGSGNLYEQKKYLIILKAQIRKRLSKPDVIYLFFKTNSDDYRYFNTVVRLNYKKLEG